MLRAYSFTLALASRKEGLEAAVERERVKVREVDAFGADVARSFTAVKDMSGCPVGGKKKKKAGWSIVKMTHSSEFRICLESEEVRPSWMLARAFTNAALALRTPNLPKNGSKGIQSPHRENST